MSGNHRRLDTFLELPENWDSYGAEPISKLAVEKAQAMDPFLTDLMYCLPTVLGGVLFEDMGDEPHFQIEIDKNGKIECVFWMDDDENSELLEAQ